jgi:hypothetical protein
VYKNTGASKGILIERPYFIGKTNVCGKGIEAWKKLKRD